MDFAKQAAIKVSFTDSIERCEGWMKSLYYDLLDFNQAYDHPMVQKILTEYVAYSDRISFLKKKAMQETKVGYTPDQLIVFSSTNSKE